MPELDEVLLGESWEATQELLHLSGAAMRNR